MDSLDERNLYLYARNQRCTDHEAARFVDWFVGSFGMFNRQDRPTVPVAFAQWFEHADE